MTGTTDPKEIAKKVNEGIQYLDSKLKDPLTAGIGRIQSISEAAECLHSIANDLKLKSNDVEGIIQCETDKLKQSETDIHNAVNKLQEVEKKVLEMENFLKERGILSFSSNSNTSGFDNSHTQKTNSFDNDKLLLDESPVFTTPNYSSTPGSDSCDFSNRQIESGRYEGTPFSSAR